MKAKKENIITSAHKENDRKRAGIFFIFGSILFFLLTTVAEAIYPNFSLQRNAISDLAALGKNTTVIEEIAYWVLESAGS